MKSYSLSQTERKTNAKIQKINEYMKRLLGLKGHLSDVIWPKKSLNMLVYV